MSIVAQKTLLSPLLQKLTPVERETQRLNSVKFEFQGGLVKAMAFAPRRRASYTLKPRGKVMDFSRRSRLNLLEKFNRIDWSAQKAIFITLTYHDNVPHERVAKQQLRAYLKRLWRGFGTCATVWRLEYQPGRGAVHFHLLAFDLPYVPKAEILRLWREVTGDASIFMTRIELIDNPKKAMRYVSKYLAKSTSWHRGVVDIATGEIAPSLVDLSFDHIWLDTQSPGRFWGIEQRKMLPLAELQVLIITDALALLHDFKRTMRKRYKHQNKTRNRGARLFTSDANQWLSCLYYMLLA